MTPGEGGYGEYTPPTEAAMICDMGHYVKEKGLPKNFCGRFCDLADENEFRKVILLAEKCPDYERG
jgi:hypothetical protein